VVSFGKSSSSILKLFQDNHNNEPAKSHLQLTFN